MKILEMWIKDYKNLKDFYIDFRDKEKNVDNYTILLGQNGSGKSNLIEAISLIFMSFEKGFYGQEKYFDYWMIYECRENIVRLERKEKNMNICIWFEKEWREISLNDFLDKDVFLDDHRNKYAKRRVSRYLPQKIICYYSGTTRRLHNFYTGLEDKEKRKVSQIYLNLAREKNENNYYIIDDNLGRLLQEVERKFVYLNSKFADFLLAVLIESREIRERKILLDYLGDLHIGRFDLSIAFKKDESVKRDKEYRYFTQRKEMEHFIMDFAYSFGLDSAAKYLISNQHQEFANETIFRVKHLNFQRDDGQEFIDLIQKLQLVVDVKWKIKFERHSTEMDFDSLSEGEKQVAIVLGMIAFYNRQDSLILLDEPETHLNAKWKYDYANVLNNLIETSKEGYGFEVTKSNSHAIVATHDPLMVNGVKADSVRLFEVDKNGNAQNFVPNEDTFGMGINNILESEYYRLTTSLDNETAKKIERQRELIATKENSNELVRLTEELGKLGFISDTRDSMYDDFVKNFYKAYSVKDITIEEFHKRDEEAAAFIAKMLKNKKCDT